MKRKGSFNYQSYLITILLVTGILVTLGMFAYKTSDNYSTVSTVQINDSFANTHNKISTLSQQTEQLQDKFEETDTGGEDSQSQFFGNALGVLKLASGTFSYVTSLIGDLGSYLFVPTIWKQIAVMSLIIGLTTLFLFMVFKTKGES